LGSKHHHRNCLDNMLRDSDHYSKPHLTLPHSHHLGRFIHHSSQVFEQGPFSTSLVLVDAVLTDITVQPASSPTSCYRLPIPTSALDLIAFSTGHVSTNAHSANDPVFFYVGGNATVPEYVAAFMDGNRYLLDVSSDAAAASRIALTLSGGESLVFDQSGMHYFDADCNSGSSALVNSFLDQILPMVNNSSQNAAVSRMSKRDMPENNFTVIVQVQDVIGSQLQGPQVSFGPSACTLFGKRDTEGWSTYTWSCQHPGANSSEKQCEASFHSWLRSNNTQAAGSGTSNANNELSSYLLRFVSKAGSSITNLFPALSPSLGKGLSWINTAESAVVDVAEFGGESVCRLLHMNDEYFLVLVDPGLSTTHTIGAYVSPPVPVISETLASWTTRKTKEPPRVVQPSATDFVSVTATSFLPAILGSLTGILGGIGGGKGISSTSVASLSSSRATDSGVVGGSAESVVLVPTVTVTVV